MGWILHQAIVVTTYHDEYIQQAHEEAKRIFNGYVTEPIQSPIDGYWSFFIPPDGSKEGWVNSDEGDQRRAEFSDWLLSQAFEDGSNRYTSVEITYGEIDEPTAVELGRGESEEDEG